MWTAVGAHTRLPEKPRQAVGLRGLTRGAWAPAGGPGLLSGPRDPPGEGQGALGPRPEASGRPEALTEADSCCAAGGCPSVSFGREFIRNVGQE